jgi:hypothetical protein
MIMRKIHSFWMATSLAVGIGMLPATLALAADNPDGERPGPSKSEINPNRADPSSAPDDRERGTTGTGNANGGPINMDGGARLGGDRYDREQAEKAAGTKAVEKSETPPAKAY